ncbi:MAG: hypothetical protein HXY40_11675 [Chloroflexi bacterium]|nr:hypothetical protein [Chloroflexota bacterium]
MIGNYLSERYYPVDIRLEIVYDDPMIDETACGLGSEKYHGLGTIGVKGAHLLNSEMYQAFTLVPARAEASPAYLKWEQSGFHTYVNPQDGMDTQPVRPSGLDILRACTHNTDGTVCADCLRKAAEAEKLFARAKDEISRKPNLPRPNREWPRMRPLTSSGVTDDDWLGEEQETEIFQPSTTTEDETLTHDPLEAALLRLEFGTYPDTRRQDVAVVRQALDQMFFLRQQLAETQRQMRRALLAEIERTAENTEKMIESLVKAMAERDHAYQEAAKAQHQLANLQIQRDNLLSTAEDIVRQFEIDNDRVELKLDKAVYTARAGEGHALLHTVQRLWKLTRTIRS